jgi:hypothetical protein
MLVTRQSEWSADILVRLRSNPIFSDVLSRLYRCFRNYRGLVLPSRRFIPCSRNIQGPNDTTRMKASFRDQGGITIPNTR